MMDKRKELIEILKGDKTYLPTLETIDKILILFDSSTQLPSRQKHTDEMFKKLKHRAKTTPDFKSTDKEMYFMIGWLECYDALNK